MTSRKRIDAESIFVDADRYATARELHLALKMLLGLPEHYGCNADALYDCLSERKTPVNLIIHTEGKGETAEAMKKVRRVFEDCGGTAK